MEFDWGDDKVSQGSTKESNWYKCILGHRDVIRIVSKIAKVRIHQWEEAGKFMSQMCSKEKHGSCPYCEHMAGVASHKHALKWATVVLHLQRSPSIKGSKPSFVGKLLAWRFGDDKKSQLMEIYGIVGDKITSSDIVVSVNGTTKDKETFQDLNINLMPESLFDRYPEKTKAALKKMIETGVEKVKEQYYPSPDTLRKFLKVQEEVTSFDPEEMKGGDSPFEEASDEPKAKPSKVKKVEAKKAVVEDEDPLAGIDDDAVETEF